MNITVDQICDVIRMQYSVVGSCDKTVLKASSLYDCDDSSLVYCTDIEKLDCTNILAPIIISNSFEFTNNTFICVDNPRLAFIRVLKRFFDDKSALIYKGLNTSIHETCVIGNSGFSFEINDDGEYEMFPHIGHVMIYDDVYIGPYCVIDRGTLDATVIGEGCKLNSYVHIGHNSKIGKNCVVHGQVFIAGSCIVGDNTHIGVGAVIRDGTTIGKNCYIGMGSVVTKDVPDNIMVHGNPAKEIRKTC